MTKKKPASELRDRDVLKRLFPKEVRDEVKRVAKDADKRAAANERKARKKAEQEGDS